MSPDSLSPWTSLSELQLRLAAFAAVLAIMAILELAIPRRKLLHSKAHRWLTNLSIIGTGFAIVRCLSYLSGVIAVPLIAIAAAEVAAAHGWGVLNWVELPPLLEFVIAVVFLDFAIWGQHVLSHKIPLLWRLHRVHHADVDIDVSTALRFHPFEIGLSMIYKVAWVLLLGSSAIAVLAFEILLNACAMFSHSNVALPGILDRGLRILVVTPDMHRIHHSDQRREHDSNYGFNLSVWDRLFDTYTEAPERGHTGMTIGLSDYQTEEPTKFIWSLRLPFRRR